MEKIGIYMKKVKFNESQIQYIIKESMEPDYIGTIDDIDGEIPQEDDWRSDEPSQGYVQSTFETIEQQCNACGAIFKNMGDNEFGVIIKDMGSANELVESLRSMEERGIIYNTGGDLSMGRVKYRIIKEINENKQVNEAYDMNQGTGAYELYEYFRVLASQGNEEAKAKMEDLIQNHHYEICEQLAWIFRDVYKENGYSDPMINSQCTTYIQRIEGSEGNEMSEELQLLGKRYLRMLNDPNLSFIDLEELGLCVYEEMKKYAEKYRKKLDQNNKKRREARLKQSEIQKVNINEDQLKRIISESVKRVLKEGLFDMFRREPSAE